MSDNLIISIDSAYKQDKDQLMLSGAISPMKPSASKERCVSSAVSLGVINLFLMRLFYACVSSWFSFSQLSPPITPSIFHSALIACPHCRRKECVNLSQKSETVAQAEFRRCLAVFGDSLTFLRQCGQGFKQFSPRDSRYPPDCFHELLTAPFIRISSSSVSSF